MVTVRRSAGLGRELCRGGHRPRAACQLWFPGPPLLATTQLGRWAGSGREDLSSLLSFTLSSFSSLPGCRIFAELNSIEMHLLIVRGMNLPAPPGSPGATPTLGGSCPDMPPWPVGGTDSPFVSSAGLPATSSDPDSCFSFLGVTPDDLDAFVRFEFHYPNSVRFRQQ